VAVNVTFVPAQTVAPGEAAMLTLAATLGLMVIVIIFDVAGLPVMQLALLVIWQVIWSDVLKALLEYWKLFVPTFAPLRFH
jgi:hypothetical protein